MKNIDRPNKAGNEEAKNSDQLSATNSHDRMDISLYDIDIALRALEIKSISFSDMTKICKIWAYQTLEEKRNADTSSGIRKSKEA